MVFPEDNRPAGQNNALAPRCPKRRLLRPRRKSVFPSLCRSPRRSKKDASCLSRTDEATRSFPRIRRTGAKPRCRRWVPSPRKQDTPMTRSEPRKTESPSAASVISRTESMASAQVKLLLPSRVPGNLGMAPAQAGTPLFYSARFPLVMYGPCAGAPCPFSPSVRSPFIPPQEGRTSFLLLMGNSCGMGSRADRGPSHGRGLRGPQHSVTPCRPGP